MRPDRSTIAALLLILMALSACAQLGIPSPKTFDERLVAGYATNTAVRESATELLKAKKISSSDAQHVLDATRNARQGLDIAKQLKAQDPKSAEAKLKAVRLTIDAVNNYLKSKERR
jgi:hypothetical protein